MTNELAIKILTGDVLGTSEQTQEAVVMAVKALSNTNGETIYRQDAIDALNKEIIKRRLLDDVNDGMLDEFDTEDILRKLPSAQPFHNITMNDVLKYIDGMPEDVWQEFTACLECRGWELQRRTAKWCGSEFT